MAVKVDREKCIGCGYCITVAPEVFELKDGKSNVKDVEGDKKYPDKVKNAKEGCPVNAISVE